MKISVGSNPIRYAVLAALLCIPMHSSAENSSVQISRMRCENLVNPLGIDVPAPRLSWVLLPARPGERNLKQTAYRVLVASTPALLDRDIGDLWDTGKVASAQQTQLAYAGKTLHSQRRAWWKVKVWDQDDRATPWSSAATWSMGLLDASDWTGQWIGIRGGDAPRRELQGARWIESAPAGLGARWFHALFEISQKDAVSYALLTAAGTGEIAVYVNGERFYGSGARPSDYVTQDVSASIHTGWNSLAIEVNPASGAAALIAAITLDREDGRVDRVQTSNQWKVADSEKQGWELAAFDDRTWSHAVTTTDLPLLVHIGERTRLPARMLRKEFRLPGAPRNATVYLSGLGYSELYINGKKVSSDVLSPGLTDYDKRVLYVTYDVTKYLHAGTNAIGILLGNGRFYAPRLNVPTFTRSYNYPEARLQLEIDCAHKQTTIVTDGTWKATANGPIRANNDYDGEEYDARMEKTGWTEPGYDDSKWMAAQRIDAPKGELRAQMMEPIRVTHTLEPVKVMKTGPDTYVFDMGQNMMGWARLHVTGAAGTRVILRYAETLRPGGELYTDNLRSARQTDVYTLKGGGPEVYEPRFTEHGFRYVEVSGYPGVPTLHAIDGRVVGDSLAEHADFSTSNSIINGIYRNILWGDRSNYRSIPTDCDQRDERQGWLGDRSAESSGESYMFDVEQFYAKWLNDIGDSQLANGQIDDVAPAYWPIYSKQAVWPASFFIVADMLHEQYGDDVPIREHYAQMKRWVAYTQTLMKNDLLPVDVYGDWCLPPRTLSLVRDDDPQAYTAPEILGTTYFYYLLHLMSQFAQISGHPQDVQEYSALAAKMRDAFNKKYFNPATNLYADGSQTSSVLALALGLAPADRRQAIANNLVKNIEEHTHGHVGVGLVGQQWLMKTLTDSGHLNVAYQLAAQTTYPSWGYMLSQGATTIWELWNGNVAGPAMNSGNHLMLLGDLVAWMYEDLAGIAPDPRYPGFKHILVAPQPVGDLRFVRASHESSFGRIATYWTRNGSRMMLDITVPPNTTATVYVPGRNVFEGGHPADTAIGVRFVQRGEGKMVYEIGSGRYVFTSTVAAPDNNTVAAELQPAGRVH